MSAGYSSVRKGVRAWLEKNPGEHTIQHIADQTGLERDAVTDVLGKMRRAGETRCTKVGHGRLYELVPGAADTSRKVGRRDPEAKREYDRLYFQRKSAQLKRERLSRLADEQAPPPAAPREERAETVAEFRRRGGRVEVLASHWT
ncbi:hypothetical protein P9A53_gp03 [Xanthomonas phage vB_Xar_IVIA-DoCa6]|uniref:Uncharacterized protein n=1 Tax=Xanthomonas phage vB_Xar_IVIA-DoCa6 TaxID=2975533 RepID=A0A9X9JQU3_9CAUD|nr:hypothetical protein P9A52_gp08 [Stenotrophomonas phage vB_SmaS-AXL_1]YP_010739053.1 hypothetical protein P9A53_gp03 [Xanthomonas phage vB_Xar_IVIA-DoCa6]UIS24773.1 hypothetical protein AXL1_08 [Stenotrophomonas phage vB_SmaS-AXL_1]UYA98747.1 hypothetical protein IVIADoCa6_3 [Xanthomonas phage vB_Xar_IVIA-DoCa6]